MTKSMTYCSVTEPTISCYVAEPMASCSVTKTTTSHDLSLIPVLSLLTNVSSTGNIIFTQYCSPSIQAVGSVVFVPPNTATSIVPYHNNLVQQPPSFIFSLQLQSIFYKIYCWKYTGMPGM